MKILEQAKKESMRFHDGVKARDTYLLSERGGARLQTSLYGIKRWRDGIQRIRQCGAIIPRAAIA